MITFVVGTRPEAIKLWPVIRMVENPRVLSTDQQPDLLPPILKELQLHISNSMERNDIPLSSYLGRMVEWVASDISRRRPAAVVVQGDTATALAAALAASYEGIPVAHVEAGLRSNARLPHPEEANRRAIAAVAELHFAPTERAAEALRTEKVLGEIHVTGNTVVDAVQALCIGEAPDDAPDVLVTLHRRENWSEIRPIALAVAAATPHLRVQWIEHGNPLLVSAVRAVLAGTHVHALSPQGYSDFVRKLASVRLAITDSGGVLEEAVSLGVPVLLMRSTTERPEADVPLVTDLRDLGALVDAALKTRKSPQTVFGDGRAAERISQVLSTLERNARS